MFRAGYFKQVELIRNVRSVNTYNRDAAPTVRVLHTGDHYNLLTNNPNDSSVIQVTNDIRGIAALNIANENVMSNPGDAGEEEVSGVSLSSDEVLNRSDTPASPTSSGNSIQNLQANIRRGITHTLDRMSQTIRFPEIGK